jgi:hypothetical protein
VDFYTADFEVMTHQYLIPDLALIEGQTIESRAVSLNVSQSPLTLFALSTAAFLHGKVSVITFPSHMARVSFLVTYMAMLSPEH